MFDEFFYLLRQYGLDVSTTEWLTVQQALSLGLHRSSLTGFYDLCRAILCKSESEYDKFDQAFEEYFYDVFYTATGRLRDDLPEDVLAMLQRPDRPDPLQYTHTLEEEAQLAALRRRAMEEQEGTPIYEDSQAQLEGEVFDGSHDIRPDDLPQANPDVIQVVRKPRRKPGHALPLWNFKDFREDNVLNIRQFQMAFRRLSLLRPVRAVSGAGHPAHHPRHLPKGRSAANPSEKAPPQRHQGPDVHRLRRHHDPLSRPVQPAVPGGEPLQPVQGFENLLLPQLH